MLGLGHGASHECDLTLEGQMGLRFKDQKNGNCFFITTTFKDWKKLGEVEGFYGCLADSLNYCTEKYMAQIAGYVLMPSHLHLLLFINGETLSDFMRDFKKYIAQKKAVDHGINSSAIWEPRYDRVAISTISVLKSKLNYIHDNPVRSGLVAKQHEWYWSSAADYLTDEMGSVKIWKDW